MSKERDIIEGLNEFVGKRAKAIIIPAKVTAVNESEAKIDVKTLDEDEIFDIRLKAVVNGSESGFLIIPAVGSDVLIARIGKSSNSWTVINYSEITRIKARIGTMEYMQEVSGFTFGSDDKMGGLMEEMIDEIFLLLSTIAAAVPVTISPGNLLAIKARFLTILKK